MLVKNTIEKRRARDLKANPQVRKTFPAEEVLRQLAKSVMTRQLHPLVILPSNVILDGECRWRGVMLVQPDHEFDVIVVNHELTPAEIAELQMISAMHSTSLTPYEQSLACKEWVDVNPTATAKQLAEKLDRDPSLVTRLLALWNTIPEVIEAAREGRCGVSAWYAISRLPKEEQHGVLQLQLAGASREAIERAVKKTRATAAPQDTAKLSRVRMPLSGSVVTVTGSDLDLAALIECLTLAKEVAVKAQKESLDVKVAQKVWASKNKAGA